MSPSKKSKISTELPYILEKQRREFLLFKSMPYIQREQESELKKYLSSSLIKIVVGPRRSGKSRLIQKVLEDFNVAYINFEDEILTTASSESIIDAATGIYPNAQYWYLDEIQDYPEWEVFLNKLHRRKINLFITGSNAKMLSSELATALTGRHYAVELLPFSYTEYLTATKRIADFESFCMYLNSGGFPEVVLNESQFALKYLSTLFDSIILKDLVRRKKIKNPNYLLNTINLIINNIGAKTTARGLSKALEYTPSYTSIEKYLHFTIEAYLFEYLALFGYKTKARLLSFRKPYLMDTGFIDAKSQSITPHINKKFENAVFLKLRRAGLVTNHDLFYYQTKQGYEIDFLVRKGSKTTQLIQVCLDMRDLETEAREIRALKAAAEEHQEAELILVTGERSGTVRLESGKIIEVVKGERFCL